MNQRWRITANGKLLCVDYGPAMYQLDTLWPPAGHRCRWRAEQEPGTMFEAVGLEDKREFCFLISQYEHEG